MIKAEVKEFYLTKIFRQEGRDDGAILTRFRSGTETDKDIDRINQNVRDTPPKNCTILTPYRAAAQRFNDEALDRIDGEEYTFKASMTGCYTRWKEDKLPYPSTLRLKEGCRVIIKKNDKRTVKGISQQVFNGNQGVFLGMHKDKVVIRLDNDNVVFLPKIKETFGTKVQKHSICVNPDDPMEEHRYEEREEHVPDEANQYVQYPIRLGFAITISASQGMTLDKVYFDLDGRPLWADAYGLLYVAFSRVRALSDLYLSAPITKEDNRVSPTLKPPEPEQMEMDVEEEEDDLQF